jgi:post-segregation antitoxin (ccd killing protein)
LGQQSRENVGGATQAGRLIGYIVQKKTLKWWCVFGEVSVIERIWRTEQKRYLRLLPEAIGVNARGRSKRLERVLTDFGCEHSFKHGAARVLEHYGFEINVSAVRDATLQNAGRAEQVLEKEYQEPFRVLPAVGAEHVVSEADGSLVCIVAPGPRKGKKPRQWKEIRLTAAQALGSTETFYAATFGEVDEVGRRWGHCTRRAGWGLNSQIHAVGDGAEWIRRQTREIFGTQGAFLCDFFHVSEYLGDAAPSCRAQAPDRWRRIQQNRLKRGAHQKVLEALTDHLEPPGTAEELAPVNNAHRYLTNRTDCIDYPRALRLGLPIGSGMIESGHRHVLQARLKKAGAAWLINNADAIANLRVMRANGQWLALWN